MYDRFSELLQQAGEIIDGLHALIQQLLLNHGERALHVVIANEIYMVLTPLHEILFSRILGGDDCNAEMDALYDDSETLPTKLDELKALRDRLTATLMHAYPIMIREIQSMSIGTVSMASLALLCVAALRFISDSLDPRMQNQETYSRHFQCVRHYALVAADEQRTTPIEHLSVHGVINALHGIYRATPIAVYSEEFERYTGAVLRRALEVLVTPGTEEVFNIAAYREQLHGKEREYRYSSHLLRDVTLLWYALSMHFDQAYVLPRNMNPRAIYEAGPEELRRARDWLMRNAVSEQDVWVRDNFIDLSMRAGEVAFYHADHPATKSSVHLVLREFRTPDYYRLTETAPRGSQLVLQTHDWQSESLHVSLIMLSTLKSRIVAAAQKLDPKAFVLLSTDLRQWSPYIVENPKRPMLVLLFNHVQLWYGGEMRMYNCALEALAAWMHVVDTDLGGYLDGYGMGELLDNFLRPMETALERQLRLAARNSVVVPPLGTGGVF